MLENWTNQKLEFPEMTQDLGGEYSPILGTFVTPDRVHCRRGPLVPAPGCAQTHEVRNYAEQRVIQRLSIVA